MRHKNLKVSISIFSLLLCLGTFAQGMGGPPGGQGGRNGQGRPGGQNGNAQRERPSAEQIIERLDTDDDGKISKKEAEQAERGRLAEDFDLVDLNEDGFIDLEELELFFENRRSQNIDPEKLIKKADKDKDGLLTEEELSPKKYNRLLKQFKVIDKNEDEKLSLDELKAFFERNKRRRPQQPRN